MVRSEQLSKIPKSIIKSAGYRNEGCFEIDGGFTAHKQQRDSMKGDNLWLLEFLVIWYGLRIIFYRVNCAHLWASMQLGAGIGSDGLSSWLTVSEGA